MSDIASDGTPNAASGEHPRRPWPARFGKLMSVVVKTARNGAEFAVIRVNCVKFEQTACAFKPEIVAKLKQAGTEDVVWFKGPIESVERSNAQGGSYSEDRMKVVYFSNRSETARAEESAERAPQAASEDTPEDDDRMPAPESAANLDDEAPF